MAKLTVVSAGVACVSFGCEASLQALSRAHRCHRPSNRRCAGRGRSARRPSRPTRLTTASGVLVERLGSRVLRVAIASSSVGVQRSSARPHRCGPNRHCGHVRCARRRVIEFAASRPLGEPESSLSRGVDILRTAAAHCAPADGLPARPRRRRLFGRTCAASFCSRPSPIDLDSVKCRLMKTRAAVAYEKGKAAGCRNRRSRRAQGRRGAWSN